MKKIINGKKYDTDTATVVDDYDNGIYDSDFRYLSETLYRKKTGGFFIYGYGGAMTEYAVACGLNSWGGSYKIIPLTIDEAKIWMEEKGSAEKYIEFFGDVEE